jgi:hypothetical protein
VHGQNSYNLLGQEWVGHDLAHYLAPEFKGEYLDRYTLRAPKAVMPLYHLVGALDPLTRADVQAPVGDGLPETLGEWITAEGLTHLKIKLAGRRPGVGREPRAGGGGGRRSGAARAGLQPLELLARLQ